MGTPRARAFVFGAIVALGACGGAEGPPGPLARHFDEMQFLGGIPVDQRQEELDAKGAYDLSLMEKAKAKSDADEAKVWLDVAKNERDSAKLDEKSATSRQKAAQASADQNRIKAAESEMNSARLAADAADKRYQYLVAYRNWVQRLIRYTEHNTYWKEAQYELAQAKIANANSIQPKGFLLDNFVKQEADRARKVKDAKTKAESEKSRVTEARTSWLALQKQSDKVLGRASSYPDPLDPSKMQDVDSKGYSTGSGASGADDEVEDTQDPTMKRSPADDDNDSGEGDAEEQADPDEGGE